MVTNKIPSPEEIRKHLKQKGDAPWLRPTPEQAARKILVEADRRVVKADEQATRAVNRVTKKLEEVSDHVKTLSTEIQRRDRMTPTDLRKALNDLFSTYDFSPAEELVQMLMNKGHEHYIDDVRLRVNVLSELQSYVMPRLKSTEIKGEVEHKHTVVVVRYGEDGSVTQEQAPRVIDRESVVDAEVVGGPNG